MEIQSLFPDFLLPITISGCQLSASEKTKFKKLVVVQFKITQPKIISFE